MDPTGGIDPTNDRIVSGHSITEVRPPWYSKRSAHALKIQILQNIVVSDITHVSK